MKSVVVKKCLSDANGLEITEKSQTYLKRN